MPAYYHELVTPQTITLGYAGEARTPILSKCADCDTETLIAGMATTTPHYDPMKLILIPSSPGSLIVKPAHFCAACLAKRIATAKAA